MVSEAPATSGEQGINRKYPAVEGLIAGTTFQEGKILNLEVEQESFVPERYKEGIY
jgi:hypothetical protein